MYTTDSLYKVDNEWDYTVYHRELYLMHRGDLNGKEVQKGGDICITMADSSCCAVEINNIAKQLYSNKIHVKRKSTRWVISGMWKRIQVKDNP